MRNGAYDPVGASDTFDGTLTSPGTTSASGTPSIGARGDQGFMVPANTRIYSMRVYNKALEKGILNSNYRALQGKHT